MTSIKQLRKLFDLGVQIKLGDDEIEIIGRDNNGEDEDSYVETMYILDGDSTLDEVAKHIIDDVKRKEEAARDD